MHRNELPETRGFHQIADPPWVGEDGRNLKCGGSGDAQVGEAGAFHCKQRKRERGHSAGLFQPHAPWCERAELFTVCCRLPGRD